MYDELFEIDVTTGIANDSSLHVTEDTYSLFILGREGASPKVDLIGTESAGYNLSFDEDDDRYLSVPYEDFQAAFDFDGDGIMSGPEWNAAVAYFNSGGTLEGTDGSQYAIYVGTNLNSSDWGPEGDMTVLEYYAWVFDNQASGAAYALETIWALLNGNIGQGGGDDD